MNLIPIRKKLATLKSEKIKADLQLRALNLKDSIKHVLKIQQTELVRDITVIEKICSFIKPIQKTK